MLVYQVTKVHTQKETYLLHLMYIHTLNGNQTNAIGIASHSEGNITRASGNYSHSEGNSTQSGGIASHSEGQHTLASSEAQHVQGKYNIEDNNGTYAHIIGNGTANNNRSNAHTIDWNGNAWYAGDIRIGGTDYSTALSLRTKIQELRDNSIKGNETGTTITLTDQYPTELLDYKVIGNSVQHTTTGKNLFNKNANYVEKWQCNKEVYQNGIKLTSTGNSGVCYVRYEFPFDYGEIKNVYCSFNKTGDGWCNLYFLDSNNQTVKSSVNNQTSFGISAIPTTAVKYHILLYGSTANIGDITIFDNIQLELGTSATSYEEYTGGIPSPNPDYPQEIYSVGDLVQSGEHQGEYAVPIKVSGKNKFDYLSARDIENTIVSAYRLFEVSGLKPNTQYNINNLGFSQPLSNIYTYLWNVPNYTDSTKYMITDPSHYNNKVGFYSSNVGKIYLGVYPSDENTWNTVLQYFANAQIEEGSSNTTYEPYITPITTNIYVDEPLRKVGTSYDYLDYKNGKLIRNIAEIESYNGETITTDYISTTGGLDIGATVDYVIEPTEETIELSSITPVAQTCIFDTDTEITGTLDITYIKDTNKVINNLESRITLLE